MASSVDLGYCFWLAGSTLNDSIGRIQDVAAQAYLGASRGGVLTSDTSRMTVSAASGMTVTVANGTAIVPNSGGSGAYRVCAPGANTLTVAASNPSNPRIDLVCVTVTDVGTSASYAQIQVITGTPSGSPVAPSLPSNSVLLATLAVAAGVTSVTSGNITDNRIYTVGAGGIIPCPNMGSLPPGVTGQLGWDVVNGRLFHLSGSGALPVHVLGAPPAQGITLTNVTAAAGTQTSLVGSGVSFTADGISDYAITAAFANAYTTTTYDYVTLRLLIDATVVQADVQYTETVAWAGGRFPYGSAQVVHVTSALKGTTPSAGTHTVTFTAQPNAQSTTFAGAGTQPIELSVVQASL